MKTHKENKYTVRKKCKIIITITKGATIINHRLLYNDNRVYKCDLEYINSRAEYIHEIVYIKEITADTLKKRFNFFGEISSLKNRNKIILYCENLKISINNKFSLIIDDNKFITYEHLKNRPIITK
jgi:hypothetical protein